MSDRLGLYRLSWHTAGTPSARHAHYEWLVYRQVCGLTAVDIIKGMNLDIYPQAVYKAQSELAAFIGLRLR
jgi:hypothetical protein